MTKVSKYPLQKDVEARMFKVFYTSISHLKDDAQVKNFFEDLLSPVEQIMLAKRFAVAILLIKKYSYYDIVDILKTSPVTIGHVSRWLKTGGKSFHHAITQLLKNESHEEFWDNLEQFLTRLIPPRRGSNWEHVRRQQFERLRNKRKKLALL